MREYLLVLCIAAAVTYLLSGVCRRFALRTGALARVRDRDVHTIEMPYFGGVAMLAGVAAAILISWQLPFLGRQVTVQQDSWAVLVAAVVICLVGVLDDVFELPPLTKFAGQVFAAGIAVALGVKMLWIPLPNQIVSLNGTTSVAITVFFIVLCSNAVNFVDGLDGLATGVVGIGALAFFAYSYLLTVTEGLTRATTSSLVTVAIAGACLGFLPHNFFPARMFMGDSGAMLLGLLLATSTISLTGQIDISQLQDGRGGLVPTVLPLVLPLAILALPFLDLSLAFVRRTYAGKWWFRRQTAPASSAVGTWPQPTPRGAADVRLVSAGLLRSDHLRAGPDGTAVDCRRCCCRGRAGLVSGHTGSPVAREESSTARRIAALIASLLRRSLMARPLRDVAGRRRLRRSRRTTVRSTSVPTLQRLLAWIMRPTHVRLQPRSPATLVRARDQVSHPIKDQLRHRHQRTAGNER